MCRCAYTSHSATAQAVFSVRPTPPNGLHYIQIRRFLFRVAWRENRRSGRRQFEFECSQWMCGNQYVVCAFAQRVIRRNIGCSRQMHFKGVAFVLFEKWKRKTHLAENNAPSHQQTITITTAHVWLSEWQHCDCFVSTWGSQPVRERAPTIIYLSFLVLRLKLNRFYYCSIHFVSLNFWWHTAKLNECSSPLIDRSMDRSNVIAKVSNDGRDNVKRETMQSDRRIVADVCRFVRSLIDVRIIEIEMIFQFLHFSPRYWLRRQSRGSIVS